MANKPTNTDGLPDAGEIAVELCATIDDLSAFLASEYARDPAGPATRVTLTGVVRLGADARRDVVGNIGENLEEHNIEDGTLELFRAAAGHPRRRVLEYILPFSHQGKKYQLHGLKVLEDDARLDAWQDTTTLSFDIEDGETHKKKWRGVLRLPAADFLERQVKSFEITGTTDPDRRVWALAAFLTFFLGKLADVYLPELKRLPPMLRNALRMSGSQ